MRKNIRHLLVVAVAIASFDLSSNTSLGQQLRFLNGDAKPTTEEANSPPEIESWLIEASESLAKAEGDSVEVAPVQFSEMNQVVPKANSEADLPTPGVSDQAETTAESSSLPLEDDSTGNGMLGQGEQLLSQNGLVEEMDLNSSVQFSSHSAFRRGYWYSEKDFVMLLRTEMEDLLLSFDPTAGASFSGFTEDMSLPDAGFTYEPGIRMTIGRFLGRDMAERDYAFELSYLGLFEFQGSSTIESLVGSTIDSALGQGKPEAGLSLPVPGFTDALGHTVNYESDFNNLELNFKLLGRPKRDRMALQPTGVWVRHATPSRIKTGLIGFRYASINDFVQYRSFYANPNRDFGNYLVRLNNDMFGVQVGGGFAEVRSDWSWGLKFKTGALMNLVNRDSVLNARSNGNPIEDAQNLDDDFLAVLVEAGVHAAYQIRPNIATRFAYDFMYITGIAEAANNMDLAPGFGDLDLTGDAFFHGLTVGLEFLY